MPTHLTGAKGSGRSGDRIKRIFHKNRRRGDSMSHSRGVRTVQGACVGSVEVRLCVFA